jgi:AcrR family transcriptional regulator
MNRKQQILELATELFGREGYDKVTVKRLADACGITEPAIYRHFRSKEDIYISVLESLKGRLDYQETFARLEDETNIETLLKTLAEHIIDFYSHNADIYRLLLFAALRGHDRAKRIFDMIRGTYVRFLVKQLDRLRREKLIIEKNNEITARCFIGMVFDCAMGMTLWKGMQGRSYEPRQVIANNVPIYSRGLTDKKTWVD